jgi:hypothetical protein
MKASCWLVYGGFYIRPQCCKSLIGVWKTKEGFFAGMPKGYDLSKFDIDENGRYVERDPDGVLCDLRLVYSFNETDLND